MSVMPMNEPLENRVEKLEDWKTEQIIADNVRGPAVTKKDFDGLERRFDALIKTLVALAFLVAASGISFVFSHLG